MDEAKFAADFLATNSEKIWNLGREACKKLDASLKLELKTAYTKYLGRTYEKYSLSKSFFIHDRAVDLYSYYVPIGLSCSGDEIDTPTFANCANQSKHVVILGLGGSGKSILMRHLFLDCIKNKAFVPVHIELRDLNSREFSLESLIEHTLDLYGFKLPSEFIEKAKEKGHFSFFLDGFDEVDHSLRKKLIQAIKSTVRKYPDCPVFVSSRPEDTLKGIDEFQTFEIMPLDQKKAVTLVEKLPFDPTVRSNFATNLKDGLFELRKDFLSNPLLLSIMLLTYSENAEIPSKLSIFYNQAYEALFQRHDAYKGGYKRNRQTNLDIQDFARVFSLFSLQTYEKRKFKMPRTVCLDFICKSRELLNLDFSDEDYLSDLLSATCLLMEDGLEISYSHRSFQEYFVARHILTASPDIQERLLFRYLRNTYSDNVIPLLLEMNSDLVERVLILPKAKELFANLGIKRKIGVTHASRYLKMNYVNVTLKNNSISMLVLDNDHNYSRVLFLIRKATGGIEKINPIDHDNFIEKMNSKYSEYATEDGNICFELADLNYRHPFMLDILNSNLFFSLGQLSRTFEAYKTLKLKHAQKSKNIEELLGI